MSVNKRILYVGGLSEEIDDHKILHAAFVPFGDIIDINMPIDFATQKHRGFAFIEFESAEDAAYAIDNMDNSEIYGKTIRVNIAKPIKLKEGASRAIWSDDSWLRKHAGAPLNADNNKGNVIENTTDENNDDTNDNEDEGNHKSNDQS